MIHVIREFAQMIDEDQNNVDCATLIILSHGGNGKIYGVDELTLDVSEDVEDDTN